MPIVNMNMLSDVFTITDSTGAVISLTRADAVDVWQSLGYVLRYGS